MLTLTLTLLAAAEAQDRDLSPSAPVADSDQLALVIGNSRYTAPGAALNNPGNDARLIAATLRELGFTVIEYHDLGQTDMKKAIDEFGQKLASGAVGLFYYSGHGLQVKGHNWLVPVDANIAGEADVEYEGVNVGRVLAKMESAGSRMNIVILDACRNNPFERSWRSAGQGSGLAFINAPAGTLIAYSTAPGNVAADGVGSNSPYTSALVQQMRVSGQTIEDTFKNTRRSVLSASDNQQTPWESSSITGSFSFSGTVSQTPAVTEPAPVSDHMPPVWLGSDLQALAIWQICSPGDDPSGCFNLVSAYQQSGDSAVFEAGCQEDAFWACAYAGRQKVQAGDAIVGVSMYQKGCEGGDGLSCYYLGSTYESGQLGSADPSRAAQLYQQACSDRIGGACGQLARQHRWGIGVGQDPAQASHYATAGCDLGSQLACYELGNLYQDSGSFTRAAELFEPACSASILEACVAQGILYYYGSGVLQDLQTAAGYQQKACDGGLMRGCTNLGIVYASWNDFHTAASLYAQACDAADVLGCYNLAILYYYGSGVLQDYSQYSSLIQ